MTHTITKSSGVTAIAGGSPRQLQVLAGTQVGGGALFVSFHGGRDT